MKTIAVIGAGTMGNGIAHTFAQSGLTLLLIVWKLFSEIRIEILNKNNYE